MKKYTKLFIGLCLIMLLIGGYLFFNGNPTKVKQIEKDTISYLSQNGFKESDFLVVEGEYEWMKIGYRTRVIFIDEPLLVNYYVYDKDGNIMFWHSMENKR